MMYTVTVISKSKHERVVQTGDANLKVYVTAVPEKGKANDAVIQALRQYFNISRSAITILRGHTHRIKHIRVSH